MLFDSTLRHFARNHHFEMIASTVLLAVQAINFRLFPKNAVPETLPRRFANLVAQQVGERSLPSVTSDSNIWRQSAALQRTLRVSALVLDLHPLIPALDHCLF